MIGVLKNDKIWVLLNTVKDDKGLQIDVLNTAKYDKGLDNPSPNLTLI